METMRQLEERLHFFAREARALRLAIGDSGTVEQRGKLLDALQQHERTEDELDIRAAARETIETARQRQSFEFENMLRTGVRATMSPTVPSQGGYTVAPLVVGEIIDALRGYGWVRQVATQYTTSTGAPGNVPTSDGTTEVGERVAENTLASSLDPSFGIAPVNTSKYASKTITVPIELLQDSAVDIAAFVKQRAVDRIGRSQNTDFTTGSGVNQPMGLLTAATVGKTAPTGQTTTITFADLADMVDSVDEANLGMPSKQPGVPARSSTGWMLSQTARRAVRKITDSNGMPVWMPGLGGELPQLLDYSVFVNNDMPSPTANAKTLAFGNFARYVIRDVRQVLFYRFDDSVYARQGQVGFLMWMRAGGNLTDVNAVKVFQQSAT